MATLNYFVSVAFLCMLCCVSADESVTTKVKITVGTTAGCSDTVNFIRDQLLPAYSLYEKFLEIEFVPWGRTIRHDDGKWTCQFRESNCWANRLHRCSLDILKGNQARQLEFMSCEFTSPFPGFQQQSYQCPLQLGLNIVDVDYCVNNADKDTLDDEAEAAAAEPMRVINFVPYIVVNDDISVAGHNEARRRLSSVICFLLAEDPSTGVQGCQI